MADYFVRKTDGKILNYDEMLRDAELSHPELNDPTKDPCDLTDFYDKIKDDEGRDLQFGCLGNGITVYDISRTDPNTRDYPVVAHISDEGIVKLYTDHLSDEDKSKITLQADNQEKLFKSSVWDKMSDVSKFDEILSRCDTYQLLQINKDKLPLAELVSKYENSIVFGKEPFPSDNEAPLETKEHDTGVNESVGISVKTLYDTYGEHLTYGRIEKNVDESKEYYDLYNDKGVMSIMDGEQAIVVSNDNDSFTLASVEDTNDSTFKLSKDEFGIAVFSEHTAEKTDVSISKPQQERE